MKWRDKLGGVLEMSEEHIRQWQQTRRRAGLPHDLKAFEEEHGLAFGAHRITVDPASLPRRRRGVPLRARCAVVGGGS